MALASIGSVIGVSLGLVLTGHSGIAWPDSRARSAAPGSIACDAPHVVDGDTLRCGPVRVRLAGIDAPELPGHCRPGRACVAGDPYASEANLRALVAGAAVRCVQSDTDRYGRAIARCTAGGTDLSCAQLAGGHAIRRYGALIC